MIERYQNREVSFDSEELILVDLDDQPIGSMRKDLAHDGAGTLHRAFSVFLFDSEGRVLMQKRAPEKRLWGDYWSNSCCSHPRVGESLEVAVERRLLEELGTAADVEFVYKFTYQASFGELGAEHEYCSVFVGRPRDTISVNTSEIAEYRWLTPVELSRELTENSSSYTPWCQQEWEALTTRYRSVVTRWSESD